MAVSKSFICAGFVVLMSIIASETVFKAQFQDKLSVELFRIKSGIQNADLYRWLYYLLVPVAGLISYQLYGLLFRPLNRVRLLGDIGYQADGKFTLKEISNRVRKRRAVGEIPPVYPNGWFAIIESWRLRKGECKTLHALGMCFVFRQNIQALERTGYALADLELQERIMLRRRKSKYFKSNMSCYHSVIV